MYSTYVFYTDDFKGTLIPSESSFDHLCILTSRKLDYYTSNQLKEIELTADIQMCVCEMSEFLYQAEQQKKDISSEKVGDYSVAYIKVTDEEINNKLYQIAKEWLWSTGYLFRGVYDDYEC